MAGVRAALVDWVSEFACEICFPCAALSARLIRVGLFPSGGYLVTFHGKGLGRNSGVRSPPLSPKALAGLGDRDGLVAEAAEVGCLALNVAVWAFEGGSIKFASLAGGGAILE